MSTRSPGPPPGLRRESVPTRGRFNFANRVLRNSRKAGELVLIREPVASNFPVPIQRIRVEPALKGVLKAKALPIRTQPLAIPHPNRFLQRLLPRCTDKGAPAAGPTLFCQACRSAIIRRRQMKWMLFLLVLGHPVETNLIFDTLNACQGGSCHEEGICEGL